MPLFYLPFSSLLPRACSDSEDIGDDAGITDENKAILEKVRLNTRQDYLSGGATGSVRATDRLMRELQDVYRSQNFKDGASALAISCRRLLLEGSWSSKPISLPKISAELRQIGRAHV